jgi:hypothetical protein
MAPSDKTKGRRTANLKNVAILATAKRECLMQLVYGDERSAERGEELNFFSLFHVERC